MFRPTYSHLFLCKCRVKDGGILQVPVQSDLLERRREDEVGILDQYVANFVERSVMILLCSC